MADETSQGISARNAFESVDSYGRVDYEGMILEEDRIRLRWHSHINQNRGADTYRFFADE